MALSGTIQTTKRTWTDSNGSSYRSLIFSWSATQDASSHKSTISWNVKLAVQRITGTHNQATVNSGSVTVNGSKTTFSKTNTQVTGTILASGSTVVQHDATGAGSFTVSMTATVGGEAHNISSRTIALDSLLGTATASLSSAVIGTASTISISYLGGTPDHVTVDLYNGSTLVRTITSSTTDSSVSYTPNATEEAVIGANTSKAFTLKCTTYSNSTTAIGSADTPITISIPDSYKPTISLGNFTYSITSLGLSANNMLGGNYGTASGTATINKAGTYNSSSATLTSATVAFNTKTINCTISGSNITIPGLDNISGTAVVTVTATDTRGRTASVTKNITVTKYTAPTFTAAVFRSTSSTGTSDVSSGEYIRATITNGTCQSIGSNAIQSNKITIGGTVTNGTSAYKNTTAAQTVVLTVTDKVSSTTITKQVAVAITRVPLTLYDDKTNVGVGIGTNATAGSFTCNLPAVFNNGITGVSISKADVTGALGFTPYNSTNPNGYTTNKGTVTGVSVNGTSWGTSGVVDIKNVPWGIITDKPTNVSSFTNDAGYIKGTWAEAWSGTCKKDSTITCTIPATAKAICASYYMDGYYATLLLPVAEGVLTGSKYMVQADGYAGGTFTLSGTTLTYKGTAHESTSYYLIKIRYME